MTTTMPGGASSYAARKSAAVALWLVRRQLRLAAAQTRAPRAALLAIILSIAAVMLTAVLGPSAAEQPWPGSIPLHAHAHPSATTVTALLALATVLGGYGVVGCLGALRRGWSPGAWRIWIASSMVAGAFALLAPVGSADPGSYVGYGALAASSHDPYVTPPDALRAPWAAVVEAPWRSTTSVYGPLATGEQWMAAKIAGNGAAAPGRAVFVIDLVNGLVFMATGAMLLAAAGTTAGRRRAAILFSANPLVLFVGVAGAHVDVVATALAIAAVAMVGRRGLARGLAAGVLAGGAIAIKASAALVGVGVAWAARRGGQPIRRVLLVLVGGAAVLVPAYLLAGHHAFDQLGRASGFVSFADPWRIITHPLEIVLGRGAARDVVRILAWIAFALLVVLLNRGLPGRRPLAGDQPPAARPAAVLVLAWLLTAPYVLPWYAVPAFALLGWLPASGYDRVLVWWTVILTIAYLPGRQPPAVALPVPRALHDALTVWKSGVAPVALLGLTLAAAVLALRRRA